MKAGSLENPIHLKSHLPERDRIKELIPNRGDEHFKFKDCKCSHDDEFVFNLIYNPKLSKNDIGLGICLLQILSDPTRDFVAQEGTVFWTVEGEMTPDKYGQPLVDEEGYEDPESEGCVWVEYNGLQSNCDYPYIHLLKELKDRHLTMTTESMMSSLKKLHEFNYLTVTDLSSDNLREGAQQRSSIRHIRLYTGMMEKQIYKLFTTK